MDVSFSTYLLTAFGMMLVIEGLLYGFFPDAMRRMMSMALALSPEKMRNFGFMMAGIGLFSIWIIAKL